MFMLKIKTGSKIRLGKDIEKTSSTGYYDKFKGKVFTVLSVGKSQTVYTKEGPVFLKWEVETC